MAQLRAKQIKLTAKNDLLIGGDTNGNGSVLSVGSEKQVLKIVNGGLAYAMQAAADVTFGDASFTATTVSAALVEAKALATTANTAAGAAQSELDATQTGAGLSAAGAYTADSSTNYIKTATSLANADKLLDAQVKTITDEISNLGNGSLTGLQAELDATQATIGTNTDGTLAAFQTGGAVAGKSTYLAAVNALDTALTAETSARAAAITQEVTDRNNAIDTALTTAEGYTDAAKVDAEAYTDNETSRAMGAESTLQSNIDAETSRAEGIEGGLNARLTTAEGNISDNTTAISSEATRAQGVEAGLSSGLTALEATVGSNSDGTSIAYNNTNFIGSNDSQRVAISKLDDALNTTDGNLSTEQNSRINGDTAIVTGAGLGSNGAYVPNTGTTYIGNAENLNTADVLLDSALASLATTVAGISGGGTGSLHDVQNELDVVEASSGLESNGQLASFAAVTGAGSTHLGSAGTLKAAIEALDSGLAIDDAAIATLQTQVSQLTGLGALHFVGTVNGNETDLTTVTPTPANGSVYRVVTNGNSNWAGTGLEVNVGDYVVCTDATNNTFVKFDNTDPVISSTDNNVDVEGGTHQGFTVALKNKAAFTSTSTAIVVTGGVGSLLSAASVALDPSKINFTALAQTGTPADQKYLKWDATAQALAYVSAGQIGVTTLVDEDFVPGTGGVAASPAANATVTLAATPVGIPNVYINGVKLKNSGFILTGASLQLQDANNGYPFEAGDVLSVAYAKYVA